LIPAIEIGQDRSQPNPIQEWALLSRSHWSAEAPLFNVFEGIIRVETQGRMAARRTQKVFERLRGEIGGCGIAH
jgi:hypothetical protein